MNFEKLDELLNLVGELVIGRESQAIQGRRERGVLRTRATENAGARRLSRQLNLLYLVVADLDRRLATEDRDQDLEFGSVLVDLGDLA